MPKFNHNFMYWELNNCEIFRNECLSHLYTVIYTSIWQGIYGRFFCLDWIVRPVIFCVLDSDFSLGPQTEERLSLHWSSVPVPLWCKYRIVCRYHRYRQQLLLLSTNPNVWKPFSVLNIFTFQTDISIYFKLSIRNRNCLIE